MICCISFETFLPSNMQLTCDFAIDIYYFDQYHWSKYFIFTHSILWNFYHVSNVLTGNLSLLVYQLRKQSVL